MVDISIAEGVSVAIPEDTLDVFQQWLDLMGVDDGFDGEAFRAAFALGFELGKKDSESHPSTPSKPVKTGRC